MEIKKNDSNSKSSNSKPSNGKPSNGKPYNSKPSNGKPSNGKPSNGKPSNGKPSNGKPSNGKPSNGKPYNGKPSNNKFANNKYSNNKYAKNYTKKVDTDAKSVLDSNAKVPVEPVKEVPITDWFYMTPSEITAKMISEYIKLHSNLQVDLWEEMNILQLDMPDKSTVDFEPVRIDFNDPSDAAFVKNRNIKTIFAITLSEENFEEMRVLIKLLFNEWDGFLCADSDDFKPLYENDDL